MANRLSGRVEVDETYIGGEEPGLRGGRAKGRKVLTGIAVEVFEPTGIGRCRIALLADASAASLQPFVVDHVELGATVITDAWRSYRGVVKRGYSHEMAGISSLEARPQGLRAEWQREARLSRVLASEGFPCGYIAVVQTLSGPSRGSK